jgi:hypothetical protein
LALDVSLLILADPSHIIDYSEDVDRYEGYRFLGRTRRE